MSRYRCPFGCQVSYARRADLKRRHILIKHNFGEFQAQPNSMQDLRYAATPGQPIVKLGTPPSAETSELSSQERQSTVQEVKDPQNTLGPQLQQVRVEANAQASALCRVQLEAIKQQLVEAKAEIEMMKKELGQERALKTDIEAQLAGERKSVIKLMDLFRHGREFKS